MLVRTEKCLRRKGGPAEIAYALKFPPGHQPPASLWIRA